MCLKDSGSIREVHDACKCFWRMDHLLHFISEISEGNLTAQCVWPGFKCYLLFTHKLKVGRRSLTDWCICHVMLSCLNSGFFVENREL